MKDRLQVGLLTPACRGFNTEDGGIAAHFADLAIGLAALGHAVHLVVLDAPRPLAALDPALAPLRISAVQSGMPRWLNRLAGWYWPLHTLAGRRWAMRCASQVLRAFGAGDTSDCIETDCSGLLALDYLRTRSRPPVVTRVSTTAAQLVTHNGNPARWHERVLQRWEARLLRGSEAVLTHTEAHRRAIAAEFRLDAGRIKLIAHGIALPRDDELPPAADATRPPRLLYVGRFEYRKGIDLLLDALPAILAAVPAAHCQLIGHDPGDHWQQRFWADNPGLDRGRVSFAGRVNAAQLRIAYRECDVFVAPSRYESFGLIYAEAMAWGKPVVGCRAGGVPEVVLDGETGVLVEAGDRDALRDRLILLLSDPALRARLGAAARARAVSHFSREVLARRSAEFYAEVANQRRHAA